MNKEYKDSNNIIYKKKGFTMIEVVAAIVILGIVSVPLLNMFVIASRGQRAAFNEERAHFLSQEVIEFFKLNTSSDLFEGYQFQEKHIISEKPEKTKWINYYDHQWQKCSKFRAEYQLVCELSNALPTTNEEKPYLNPSPISSNRIVVRKKSSNTYVINDVGYTVESEKWVAEGIYILYEAKQNNMTNDKSVTVQIENTVEDKPVILSVMYEKDVDEVILDLDKSYLGGGVTFVDYEEVSPVTYEKGMHVLHVAIIDIRNGNNDVILELDSIKYNDTF